MSESFYIAATGMVAHQREIDTIAHNMANLSTPGFKRARVNFSDLVLQTAPMDANALGGSGAQPIIPGLSQGVGVREVSLQLDAGNLIQTGDPMDIAIQGDAFIEVSMADGSSAFVQGGHFKINEDGLLAIQGGQVVRPLLRIPAEARQVLVSNTGRVSYVTTDLRTPMEAGQLELVRFTNPAALNATGAGLYKATAASGQAISLRNQDLQGIRILQGSLENSNVKLVDEMVALTMSQRAFEANSKVIQASDQLLEMINNLRK